MQPVRSLGVGLWRSGDGSLIDGVGPDGIAAATRDLSRRVGRLQSGFVYHYAFAMLIDEMALGAIGAGWVGAEYFVGDGREAFWRDSLVVLPENDSLAAIEGLPTWVKVLPLIIALSGIAIAYLFYMFRPSLPGLFARRFRPIYIFLLNKWYFDELFDKIFVQPARSLGVGLWRSGDGSLIDGVGPDGIAAATRDLSRRVGRLQSGFVYHYAFAMLMGVFGLVTWYVVTSGG